MSILSITPKSSLNMAAAYRRETYYRGPLNSGKCKLKGAALYTYHLLYVKHIFVSICENTLGSGLHSLSTNILYIFAKHFRVRHGTISADILLLICSL